MSAYVVSKKHIAVLANFAVAKKVWLGDRSAGPDAFEYVYKTLADENVRSVCHRYADEKPEAYADFLRPEGRQTLVVSNPVAILKLCQCLDYQSSETHNWQETRACSLLKNIVSAAINALPGYDEAPWSVA
jgi:hypothetical protein